MNENQGFGMNGRRSLEEEIKHIGSHADLVHFVEGLRAELRDQPEKWENRDLESYLEALGAWVKAMEGFYRNRGQAVPEQPTWETLGQILAAARVYE